MSLINTSRLQFGFLTNGFLKCLKSAPLCPFQVWLLCNDTDVKEPTCRDFLDPLLNLIKHQSNSADPHSPASLNTSI